MSPALASEVTGDPVLTAHLSGFAGVYMLQC